jgi:anti-sigma28 factor (negative regulator of flagellin synthesis)
MVNKISANPTPLTLPVKGMPAPEAGVLGTHQPDKAVTPPAVTTPATQLHLSESLNASVAAAQTGALDDPFDAQLVQEIRQRMDSGSFQIDFNEVASNILREAIAGTQTARR